MKWQRRHLIEFHDWSYCPNFIRESIVETLGRAISWGSIYHSVTPVFAQFLKDHSYHQFDREGEEKNSILDLGSGSGAPVSALIDQLKKFRPPTEQINKFILSDLAPRISCMKKVKKKHPDWIDYHPLPLNALRLHALSDCPQVTLFNIFHHFNPPQAFQLLQQFYHHSSAFFIQESFPRNPFRLISMLYLLIPAVFMNPFTTKNDRWLKFFFTFIFPLIPLIGLWDGLVSTLRVYEKDDLLEMWQRIEKEDQLNKSGFWQWKFETISFKPWGKSLVFYAIKK